jgi:hypothetical protein
MYNDGVPLDLLTHSSTSDLVHYWRNNNLDSNGKWKDLKGSNVITFYKTNDYEAIFPEGTTSGRDINGFFLTHPNKNYLSLDGVKTHVDIPGNAVFNFGTGSFTIEAWIKTIPSSGYQQAIWAGNTSLLARAFIASTGKLTFKVDDNSTEQDLTPDSVTWDDNTWSHLVCVRDADNNKLKVYQNSVLIAQSTLSATGSIDASSGILIGKHYSDFNTNFKGFIDDVRVYNRVLTDGGLSESNGTALTASASGEIRKNYRHGSGKHKD